MKLSDFRGIKNSAQLSVLSVENPHSDYYTVKMALENGVSWRPGEHGIFKLPGKTIEGRKWRAFSVASTPEEGFLLLGTRTGDTPSSYKRQLINLKPGDKVDVRGPFGWFTMQDEITPVVMIAGGVGITPIRALLKSIKGSNQRQVDVLYASGSHYLFEDDLKAVIDNDENMTLHKTVKTPETQHATLELAKKYGNSAYYYVSGNIGMIKDTKQLLKGEGIKGNRIINDPFLGY